MEPERAPAYLGFVDDAVLARYCILPFYGWLRATVVALLRRAEKGGEIRTGLDLECAADTLLAALNIELYLCHAGN